ASAWIRSFMLEPILSRRELRESWNISLWPALIRRRVWYPSYRTYSASRFSEVSTAIMSLWKLSSRMREHVGSSDSTVWGMWVPSVHRQIELATFCAKEEFRLFREITI